MKKLNVGDSINFKDGKTGIVEDYDDEYFYVKDNNTNIIKIKKIKDDNQELKNKFSYCKQNVDKILQEKGLEIYSANNGPDLTYYLQMATKKDGFDSNNFDFWTEENIKKPIEDLMKRKYPKFSYDLKPILLNNGKIGVEIHIQAKDSANIKDFSRLAYEYEPEEDDEEEIDSFESEEEKELRKEAEQKYSEDISEEINHYTREEIEKAINNVLNTLTEQEKRAIELRFGLNGETPHTYKELGKLLNHSTETVRSLVGRTIWKLKHPNRSKELKKYLAN